MECHLLDLVLTDSPSLSLVIIVDLIEASIPYNFFLAAGVPMDVDLNLALL